MVDHFPAQEQLLDLQRVGHMQLRRQYGLLSKYHDL